MKEIRQSVFFFLLLTVFFLIWHLPSVNAQPKPLTYPEIITALNSKVPNRTFKSKTALIDWLITQVKQRRVEKALSSEMEETLRQSGATDELIDTIRLKSPNVKSNLTPTVTPTPKPIPKPTPTSTYDNSSSRPVITQTPTMPSNLGVYYGWTLPPVVRGNWMLADEQSSKTLVDKLLMKYAPSKWNNTIREIKNIRTLNLPFYTGAYLCEGLIKTEGFNKSGIFTFVVLQDGAVILLDGTSSPIHELNAKVPLSIDTKEKAEAYLRFFGALVFGAEGNFRLIDGEEILWEEGVMESDKQDVERQVKTLQLERGSDNLWKADATVQYYKTLFAAKFNIPKNGVVEMVDDKPLKANLPIRQQKFNGPVRYEIHNWALPPVVKGTWVTTDEQISKTLFDKLMTKYAPSKEANIIRQIKSFRALPLPFYSGAKLYEGLIPLTNFSSSGIFTFVVLQDGAVILLDGTSSPIHELNAKVPLSIDTKEKAEAYLRFFGALVFGAEGNFRLIDGEEILWEEGVMESDKKSVETLIKPVKINNFDGKVWKAEATIQYSNAIFLAKFNITKTGMLEMLEDKPLKTNLLIRQQKFNGTLRHEVKKKSKPSLETETFNRGNGAFDKGDYKNAIALYTEAIKLNSQNPELFMKRGYAKHYHGDGDGAVEDYKLAIKITSDLGSKPLLKCLLYFTGEENADVALNNCNLAISDYSGFSLLYYKRALTFIGKSDNDRALADNIKAIELNPNFVGAYRNRASIYFNKRNYDEAIKDYNKMIELRGDYIDGYIGRGGAYLNKGDDVQALKDYNRAIQLKPNESSSYIGRGAVYEKKENFYEAIKDYSKAIELDPKITTGYISRGNVYHNAKNYEDAIQDYTRAIGAKPEESEAYFLRGNSYFNLRNYEKAIEDYSRVIKLVPNSVNSFRNRGLAFENQSNYESAIADYRKALQLDPNNERVKTDLERVLKKKK